jgi:hypothetical protein
VTRQLAKVVAIVREVIAVKRDSLGVHYVRVYGLTTRPDQE